MADSPTGFPKQTLKRVEIHLNKFNEVAIPHHVDLLKKHKSNIEKFQEAGDWDRIHREQINATRLIKQLKALLYEMDMLRNQVQDADLQKFDKLTAVARQNALDAIKEYLDMNPQRLSPVWLPPKKFLGDDTSGDESQTDTVQKEVASAQLRLTLSQEEVEKQEACLKSWEGLQTEVQDIHALFKEFAQVVESQKEDVETVESNVITTQENVHEGTRQLQKAARYSSAIYPLAGAVIGGCLGGPIGLVAGAKLGGLTALGCGFLGFTGGRLLKKRQEQFGSENEVELLTLNQDRNVKGSISLPTLVETDSKPKSCSSESPVV
ncbi:syntaxin-17 [Anabrus simplex]|uniref:syntaxin-17 n=1 Tax=Anabrus simplex TaxID=316456 RepID=UPI0035A2E0CA